MYNGNDYVVSCRGDVLVHELQIRPEEAHACARCAALDHTGPHLCLSTHVFPSMSLSMPLGMSVRCAYYRVMSLYVSQLDTDQDFLSAVVNREGALLVNVYGEACPNNCFVRVYLF